MTNSKLEKLRALVDMYADDGVAHVARDIRAILDEPETPAAPECAMCNDTGEITVYDRDSLTALGTAVCPHLRSPYAALARTPPQNPQEWRNLKDSPEGVEVLAFSRDGDHVFYDCAYRDEDTWFVSWSGAVLANIEAWMPLPAAPRDPGAPAGKA